FWVGTGELVLDDEPSDRIQIDTRNLEAKARSFNQCGATAHEAVKHLQILEVPSLLVVGIVHIPNRLCCFRLIWDGDAFSVKYRCSIFMLFGWRFHGGGPHTICSSGK